MLQQLAQFKQEEGAAMAVGDAVIGRQAGDDAWQQGQLAVVLHGAPGDAAKAGQRDLGRIDHAEDRIDALIAQRFDEEADNYSAIAIVAE